MIRPLSTICSQYALLSWTVRLDQNCPLLIVMLHVTLKDRKAYKALYKPESLGQCGTSFHLKTVLRRTNANGNVKSNYKAHEELLLLIVKALVHIAADDITNSTEQNRDTVLSHIFSKIYGLRCSNDDFIHNYYCNLITWGMQIINMNDTAKEGDTERLMLNMKENAVLLLKLNHEQVLYRMCKHHPSSKLYVIASHKNKST
ncbi:unnamed protein product [Mytilus coruscus]|uniref:Uncharacterized protein n=1 Tax=Mytilus coruscus TaxID=42192 RepID=A0A6J8CYZ6_MYTCO|nr:unnamed protein product [Mytilus coruscus]